MTEDEEMETFVIEIDENAGKVSMASVELATEIAKVLEGIKYVTCLEALQLLSAYGLQCAYGPSGDALEHGFVGFGVSMKLMIERVPHIKDENGTVWRNVWPEDANKKKGNTKGNAKKGNGKLN